jgi:hypothetical protein
MGSRENHNDAMGLKALVVPVDGPVFEVELDPDNTLGQLQGLVGGLIQALPLPDFIPDADRASVYVNEEGHVLGLEFNGRGTDYMVPGCGIFFGDYIAGPFVLCGFNPRTGKHAELPQSVISRARLIEEEAGQ